MPLTQRLVLYCSVILFSVPVQYYLSEYCRSEILQHLITKLQIQRKFQETFLSFILLRARIEQEALFFFKVENGRDEKKSHLEQLKYNRFKTVSNRPKFVKFRVGQVVGNLREGYKGVIIAWRINPKNEDEPLYTILVDDRKSIHKAIENGVTQDELYEMESTKVKNRFMKIYFDTFDGTQYIPQPWLRARFPKD